MKSAKGEKNKPGHVTRGDVLEDLGLSREELVTLRVKTELWRELVAHIEPLKMTQKELAQRLGVHQPEVSHLMAGKLSKFSAGTLIQYAVKLNLGIEVKITASPERGRVKSMHAGAAKTKVSRKLAAIG
jgi:predicted XRE-type DNA-binding protein